MDKCNCGCGKIANHGRWCNGHWNKINPSMKGKHHSEEARKKMSEYGKGLIKDKNPFYGKKHTKESKKKISESHKGKVLSEEHKRKIGLTSKGRICLKETKKKISEANIGNLNGMWGGDKITYEALHQWIRRNKPKTNFCEECKIKKPFDVANISGEYKRDINDFKWLCRSCHMKEPYRKIRKIKQSRNPNYFKYKEAERQIKEINNG